MKQQIVGKIIKILGLITVLCFTVSLSAQYYPCAKANNRCECPRTGYVSCDIPTSFICGVQDHWFSGQYFLCEVPEVEMDIIFDAEPTWDQIIEGFKEKCFADTDCFFKFNCAFVCD